MKTENRLNKLAGLKEKSSSREIILTKISKGESQRYYDDLKKRKTFSPFSYGDTISYKGNKYIRFGRIVEVVPLGKYPNTQVKCRGYYRNFISYVVLLNSGEYIWPFPSRLSLIIPRR